MANRPSECSGDDVIRKLAREALPEEDVEALYRHLEDCPSCWERYRNEKGRETEFSLPGYLIIRELGRGRTSVVYKAWWLKNKPRLVALKLLWPADEEQRARFDREIKVQTCLDIPNIVKCFDSGGQGTMMYYAMEWIRGQPLDTYLTKHTQTLDEKLVVFQRICKTLSKAHAQGISHRDLKPSNILVNAAGQPHLLDFGLCGVESGEWSTRIRRTQTRPGDVMGTVRYMSPEQAWGGLIGGAVDYRTDIWSLGIILYEIATDGDYPYTLGPTAEKTTEEALLYRIRTEMPRPPHIKSAEHANDLKKLIGRCLAWDKRHRIQSAKVLEEDIERCLINKPVKTRSLPYYYRMHRIALGLAIKRRGLLWFANTAFILLLLSFLAFAGSVRWRVSGHAYMARTQNKNSAVETGDARDAVLIIGITNESLAKVPEYARENGIKNVTRNIKSWRAVSGHVMERLAKTSPMLVVWDFYFETREQGNKEFIAGVQALNGAGIPAAIAARGYREDKFTPRVDAEIYEALKRIVHFGSIAALDPLKRPGEFIVAVKHGRETQASLGLAAAAALLHPEYGFTIEWSGRNKYFHLSYSEREPGGSTLPGKDRIDLTDCWRSHKSEKAVREGDFVASKAFDIERPEVWKKRTIALEHVLTANDEELETLVAGKIVLFGDLRAGLFGIGDDRHSVKYGNEVIENVPGCYLIGDSINGFLNSTYLKSAFPLNETVLALMGLFAFFGCLIPIPLAKTRLFRKRVARILIPVALLSVCPTCIFVMTSTYDRLSVELAMIGVAVTLAMLNSFWIEFARTQRRVFQVEKHSGSKGRQSTERLNRLQLAGR